MSEEGLSVAENTNEASHGATATDADTNHVNSTTPSEGETSASILSSVQGSTEEQKTNDGEQSADGEKPADGEKQDASAENAGAPETYQDFNTPDGATIDPEVSTAFKTVAKDLNLTQDQAQSIVDKLAPTIISRQKENLVNIAKTWAEASAKDPEIGGANWKASCSNIARVRDMFAKNEDGTIDKDVAEFMNSPMGNHPGVLKLLSRAGRAFGEASFPHGSRKSEEKTYSATQFYEDAKRH